MNRHLDSHSLRSTASSHLSRERECTHVPRIYAREQDDIFPEASIQRVMRNGRLYELRVMPPIDHSIAWKMGGKLGWFLTAFIVNCFNTPFFRSVPFNLLYQRAFSLPSNTSFTVSVPMPDQLVETAKNYRKLAPSRNIPSLFAYHQLAKGERMTNHGTAIIASYLREKNHLSTLFVCSSFAAFKSKLNSIAASKEDCRVALVVTSHQFEVVNDKEAGIEQHKMAVCIEKKDGHLRLAVMEPSPLSDLNPANLHLKKGAFTSSELVFAHIREAKLDPLTTSYYFSRVMRQFGVRGGCTVFALRDAVSFLKNPHFFQQLRTDSRFLNLPWGKVQKINRLPADHMKSTQSMRVLNAYFSSYSHDPKTGVLKDCLSKHLVESHLNNCRTMKWQNRYVDDRMEKYGKIIIRTMRNQTDQEVYREINRSLI